MTSSGRDRTEHGQGRHSKTRRGALCPGWEEGRRMPRLWVRQGEHQGLVSAFLTKLRLNHDVEFEVFVPSLEV